MQHTITLELNPSSQDLQVLGDGIMQFASQKTTHKPMEFFAVFIRNDKKEILGGCSGSTLYGCLYIDSLWINELLRHQGYGTRLVNEALKFGLLKKCTFATVNTMDWEALGFYQKLGFEIEFKRTGFDHGSTFYFLRKSLQTIEPTKQHIIENTQFPWKKDKILCAIVDELKTTYHCHTIILYGSRARGDFKPTSDYDVAGITAIGDKKWIARFDENHRVFHDIFIFPENEVAAPNEAHLQMSDGIVLIDHKDIGKHLIETLKTMENKPLSITSDEIQARKTWYQKMLARAELGDLEGKYRHIWSIFTILEDYFAFQKLRYHGPKKAFQYLAEYDPDTLNLFEHALSNTNDVTTLKQLIVKITQNNHRSNNGSQTHSSNAR